MIVQVDTEHASCRDARGALWQERLRRRLARAMEDEVVVVPYTEVEDLREARAVVLSGSLAPWALHDEADLDRLGAVIEASGRPVLGICAGLQLLGRFAGARIVHMAEKEVGEAPVRVLDDRGLLAGLGLAPVVYHVHGDEIVDLPPDLRVLAETDACRVQAIADDRRRWYGTQFHPECYRSATPAGERILRNFAAIVRASRAATPA